MSGYDNLIRGSGNGFGDLGYADEDREDLWALLAAEIIGVLDDRHLTVQAAEAVTWVGAADFSRIRKVKLGRFTIDRLVGVLAGLGQEV